jgi:hypothetical protein
MTEPRVSEARRNVLRVLASRQDDFATEEQLLRGKGEDTAAEGCHRYALIVLRAYRAELDDPAPQRWAS